MSVKKRLHVTLPTKIADALEALAALNGQSLSGLLEGLGRGELKARGLGEGVTAAEIEAEIASRKKRKRK